MGEYVFGYYVEQSRHVFEESSYLEIFSYSDPVLNTMEEHPLPPDEIENFVYRREAFQPRVIIGGVTLVGGLRLILQQNAKDPDTFAPRFISLNPVTYTAMVKGFNLSRMGVESTGAVGPFFWSTIKRGVLQIIYKKADVKKKGLTRGWELNLSHDLHTGITSGFCKGTRSSDIVQCIGHIKACALQINHPMLLPIIIFSQDLSPSNDIKQRDARDWLRKLEHALSERQQIDEIEGYYVNKKGIDYDLINRHLSECYAQVLWKRPKSYIGILSAFTETLREYLENLPADRKTSEILELQSDFLERIKFFNVKLQGTEGFAATTLERLSNQREVLSIASSQYNNRVNFQMAGAQQRLAHASKRDAAAQKTLALLGAIFLPGAFIASIFSMTFFNWQQSSTSSGESAIGKAAFVSSSFWIYWVVSIPFTLLVVGAFFLWERRQNRDFEFEDSGIERDMELIEIQARHRTATKSRTMNVPWR